MKGPIRCLLASLVATLCVSVAPQLHAEEPLPLDAATRAPGVIQNRKYDLLHEVTLLGGGLPTDPFYNGLSATLGIILFGE